MSDQNMVVFPDGHVRDLRLLDFRNFLYICWRAVGLPKPTRIQYDIADFLQHSGDRVVLEAFRGVGKSWILCAFDAWNLYWDPDEKLLVTAQAKGHADDISTFILQLINTVPGLAFLSPLDRDRKSKVAFDVGPAKPAKQPSVKSQGIEGAITGSRGGVILGDDIESLNNSLTQLKREKIRHLAEEFEAVVSPSRPAKVVQAKSVDTGEPLEVTLPCRTGRIIYLGTPQLEDSLYNHLLNRGYEMRVYPAEYPDERQRAGYGGTLAPVIAQALDKDPTLVGKPTDPERFGEMELVKRRASYARSGYALQFMLDTTLSDETRYPLKLRDLIVMSIDQQVGPEKLLWSPLHITELPDLPAPGLKGDRFYGPLLTDKTVWQPFQGTTMFIDPAGTGQDETAYAIVKQLHGLLFVMECTGIAGGYNDSAMVTLATRAKVNGVNLIQVESNFGDGMFTKLLQPHLGRIYPCAVEEIKQSKQKELRIIDTLEPVMNQHRLIVDRRVVENDGHRRNAMPADMAIRYELFYQMTRITKEKGSLIQDDRLDALAGAVAYWVEAMGKDTEKAAASTNQEAFFRSLDGFFKNTFGIAPKYDAPRKAPAKTWTSKNRGCTRT